MGPEVNLPLANFDKGSHKNPFREGSPHCSTRGGLPVPGETIVQDDRGSTLFDLVHEMATTDGNWRMHYHGVGAKGDQAATLQDSKCQVPVLRSGVRVYLIESAHSP